MAVGWGVSVGRGVGEAVAVGVQDGVGVGVWVGWLVGVLVGSGVQEGEGVLVGRRPGVQVVATRVMVAVGVGSAGPTVVMFIINSKPMVAAIARPANTSL